MGHATEASWEQHNEAGCRYFGQGAYADAEQEFLAAIREGTALGAENLRLASSLSNLGQLKYRQRDLAQAETLFLRALTIREHVLGSDHFGVAQSVSNLAVLHYARGELDAAEPLFRRALELSDRHLGRDHPDVAAVLNNLARLYFRRSDFASAAPLLTRLLALKEAERGADHPEVATILASLARVRYAAREYEAAEPLARRALVIRERTARPDDPTVKATARLLAEICTARGKPDESRHLSEQPQANADDAHDSLAFVHGAEPIEPLILDRAPQFAMQSRVSPPPTAMTPAPASPAPAAASSVPPLELQPFPESVLPVGVPVSRDAKVRVGRSAARPSDEVRPPASRDSLAHDAPAREARRTPARRSATMRRTAASRGAHGAARQPASARSSSLFGAVFKLALLLVIVAVIAWLIAGRPPLLSVVTKISGAAADSIPAPADSTLHR